MKSSKALRGVAKAGMLLPLMTSTWLLLVAQGPPAASLSEQLARFQRQLAESGYVSQPGTEFPADFNQSFCSGLLFSGMGPNPGAPPLATGLPEVPGQAPNTNPPVTWRLRQDEAVVIIGLTPPPAAYFSFSLTMMRGALSTGPLLWVSIGDPLTNLTVRTTGSTPFDRPFAVVITGNRRTQAEVDKMLAVAGLGGATNDVPIPPAMFRLGLDKDSDEFFIGTRMNVPKPGFEQARDDYVAAPPLWAFRVRPKSSSADQTQPVYASDPLPVPPLRVSGTGTTELDLNPTLLLLRQRIVDRYPGYQAHDVPAGRLIEESYPGLQQKLLTDPPIWGVGAATYDATYLLSRNFSLPDGSFVVAYGTNHVATGKATYASATIGVDAKAVLTLASAQHTNLQGSARDFIADQQNADQFYAWAFTRAGSSGPQGPHVTALPPTSASFCQPYGTSRPVDMSTVSLIFRAYAEPTTKTRPALSELLLDRLLLFTPK